MPRASTKQLHQHIEIKKSSLGTRRGRRRGRHVGGGLGLHNHGHLHALALGRRVVLAQLEEFHVTIVAILVGHCKLSVALDLLRVILLQLGPALLGVGSECGLALALGQVIELGLECLLFGIGVPPDEGIADFGWLGWIALGALWHGLDRDWCGARRGCITFFRLALLLGLLDKGIDYIHLIELLLDQVDLELAECPQASVLFILHGVVVTDRGLRNYAEFRASADFYLCL